MSLCLPIHLAKLSLHDAENYAKKLIGTNDIEAVLWRLDRLTMEESRMTVMQIMEVVYGLFKNIEVVMDGTRALLDISFSVSTSYCFRWKGINK